MFSLDYDLINSNRFSFDDRRLLAEAKSARTALETEGSMPSFFAGSEEEWRQFTNDLRLTSGVGKARRKVSAFFK
jgi:hypothetical protein